MVPENKKVQRVRQQISALAAETRMTSGSISSINSMPDNAVRSSISILAIDHCISDQKGLVSWRGCVGIDILRRLIYWVIHDNKKYLKLYFPFILFASVTLYLNFRQFSMKTSQAVILQKMKVCRYSRHFSTAFKIFIILQCNFLIEKNRMRNSIKQYQKLKVVRSFSSMEVDTCECMPILMSVYSQVIDHCRAVGKNFTQRLTN